VQLVLFPLLFISGTYMPIHSHLLNRIAGAPPVRPFNEALLGPFAQHTGFDWRNLAVLLLGERPGTLAMIGIGLALPAIVGVSASPPGPGPAGTGHQAAGVMWGLLAGASFAVLFIALNRAGTGSGLWPIAATEVTALVAVTCLAAATGEAHLPPRRAIWPVALTGVTGTAGTVLYFYATHAGLLAVTAVLTSLYPAVTIVLARVFLGERLTVTRLTGLCLAAASIGLIAAAGAG
jgi:drug/metabolite transporter (DMT)-like permease